MSFAVNIWTCFLSYFLLYCTITLREQESGSAYTIPVFILIPILISIYFSITNACTRCSISQPQQNASVIPVSITIPSLVYNDRDVKKHNAIPSDDWEMVINKILRRRNTLALNSEIIIPRGERRLGMISRDSAIVVLKSKCGLRIVLTCHHRPLLTFEYRPSVSIDRMPYERKMHLSKAMRPVISAFVDIL